VLREILETGGCLFEEIEVDVLTWGDFIEAQGISHIDLMVLDVEGHELEVLSRMKESRVLPHVMCVEFGHIGLDELRTVMLGLGYEYDVTSHANAFFVRKDMLSTFALRQAATPSSQFAMRPTDAGGSQPDTSELKAENEWLRLRETELVNLVTSITNSRGWKALELARRVLHPWGRAPESSSVETEVSLPKPAVGDADAK
jgi:hypothetical protein